MKLKNLTKYIIAAIIIAGVLYTIITNLYTGAKHTTTSFALNTYTSITAYGKNGAVASENAKNEVSEVEKSFSAYVDTSEISKINNIKTKDVPIKVSDELFYIIKTAQKYSDMSDGMFDITLKPVLDLWSISRNPRVPSVEEINDALLRTGYKNIVLDEENKTITFLKDGMALDLGAIAKGYAADRACDALYSAGCEKALVDLGGNICVMGENVTPGEKLVNRFFGANKKGEWTIGIQTPFASSGSYCAIVSICASDKTSVVTSGAYERNFTEDGILYHHIFNPKTGYPHNGEVDSVTIIGQSSMEADVLSTSAFILDIDSAIKLVKECGYDAVIIDKNKKIHTTLDKGNVEIVDSLYSFAN